MKRSRRRALTIIKDEVCENDIVEIADTFDGDTVCNICYAEFLELGDLKHHTIQVHLNEYNKIRFCKFCSTLLPNLEQFVLHIRDVHLSCMKTCKYCHRLFNDADLLRKHENKHYSFANKSSFRCSQCKELFSEILQLAKHEYDSHRYNDDGIFLHFCFPLLSSMLGMKASVLLQRLDEGADLLCVKCGTVTRDPTKYLEHLKIKKCHVFACDNCSNVYNEKRYLYEHMIKCTRVKCQGERKSKECKECNKYFDSLTLKKHIQSCKSLKCRACNIKFNNLYELSSHQTMEHPLAVSLMQCKYCRKDFVGVNALERHITRTHGQDKHLYKYCCYHCNENYIFKHPRQLFSHFMSKHKDISPYTCDICKKQFVMRKKFSLHIKLDHKSIGHVVFDKNFHVLFCDKPADNSTNIDDGNNPDIQLNLRNDKVNENPTKKIDMDSIHLHSDTDANLTEMDNNERDDCTDNIGTPIRNDQAKRKLKSVRSRRGYKNKTIIKDNSDEDEPLVALKRRLKYLKHSQNRYINITKNKHVRYGKKRFMCNICKICCASIQQYHNHLAIHLKRDPKKCVKCSIKFKSMKELKEHISDKHSASRLTETLKRILEKRKSGNEKESSINHPAGTSVLTSTEKFLKTIKKVPDDVSTLKATIVEMPKGISVKKFIENFTPDANDSNRVNININSCINIRVLEGTVEKSPKIKMTKFKPDNLITCSKPKLSMPIKFKHDSRDTDKAVVTIVQNPIKKKLLNFGQKDDESEVFDGTSDYYEEVDNDEETIPEVAQEVMLEDEASNRVNTDIVHKISLPNIPSEYGDIKIAHLVPKAPYFKILSVKDVLEANNEQEPITLPNNPITLPSGMKLVNVNPLAHLLVDKPKALRIPKQYYKPKLSNFVDNITKALSDLENPVMKTKKKSITKSTKKRSIKN